MEKRTPTKAKPALEGRALFGDEVPETQFIAVLNFPKMTLEGERRGIMDVHLPNRRMAEVELADALIRIFDYAGAFGYDLDGALTEKMHYNAHRADHKHNARLAAGGKKF